MWFGSPKPRRTRIINPAFSNSFRERFTVMLLRQSSSDNSTIGKQINRIPLLSSMPAICSVSNSRAYKTFAILLIGSRSAALGSGIQGGRGVSIVINSKSIQAGSSFFFLARLDRYWGHSTTTARKLCLQVC